MNKGVSETFDEHEHDTAPRAYPQEVLDGTKRTTKMARLDLNELRTGSGTRPVLTHDAIERHVREKMEDALAPRTSHVTSIVEDPHSRPTIEAGMAGIFDPIPVTHATDWTSSSTEAPTEPVAPASASRPVKSISGWVVAVILFGLVLMLSAAGSVGFVLGRRSMNR
ncbi:MAG: hypothetical protein K0S65_3585 [Labilithrix sp.]|nr:hypothetical protein [Labilithrix sp.]